MQRYALSLILALVCVSNLLAQSTAVQPFDVRRYGAKGDGTTDDTTAIQNAINAAEAAATASTVPVSVFFPRGVYSITIVTVDSAGVTLTGENNARLKGRAGTYNAMIHLDADRTGVRNIEVDANYPSVTPTGDGTGILIGDADDIEVRDCYVHDTYGSGIVSQQGGEGHHILHCRAIDCGVDGINISGDAVTIDGCEIIDWNRRNTTGPRAIKVDPVDVDNDFITIQNCVITMQDEGINYVDEILIDPGDGDIEASDSGWLDPASSGVPVEDGDDSAGAAKSYAKLTIDAGHGFMPGDMLWLANGTGTDAADYNGIAHVIRKLGGTGGLIDGNVFIRVVDANTITLHASAIDAKGPSRSNTSQAVSATSITLDASASATNNYYLGMSVKITNGAASGSIGQIVSYNGTTKAATVQGWSGSTPTGTPTFTVAPAVDLTSAGSGTFYIGSPVARVKRTEITASTDVNTTTDQITCTGHNFRSGFMARLTPNNVDSDGDALPGGLANAATVTFSVPWVDDDTNDDVTGLEYRRPKRIRDVTIQNIQITHAPGLVTSGTNGIKVNNVENLLIDRVNQNQPPENNGIEFFAIRLGQNNRKVAISNVRSAGPFKVNTASLVPELIVDNCEFGDVGYANDIALETVLATRFTLRNSVLRFRVYGINSPDTAETEFDDKIALWNIHDNIIEGFSAKTIQAFDFENTQLINSRKLRFHSNTLRNVHPSYRGVDVSSVSGTTLTLASGVAITTRDLVQVRLNGGALTGATDLAWYYVRKITNTTCSLHPTEADAAAGTNGVSVSGLSGSVTLWNQAIGLLLSDLVARNVALAQVPGNESQVYDVAAPTSASFSWKTGDTVWNMNATASSIHQPVGWVCTAPGAPGTWDAMPPLNGGIALADTTELGNVGGGQDNLISFVLPANSVPENGASLEIEAGFTFAANANLKAVTMVMNGNTLYDTGSVAQNGGSLVVRILLVRESSTNAEMSVQAIATAAGVIASTSTVANQGSLVFGSAMTVKGTGSSVIAATTDDVVMRYMRVRALPSP